MIGSLYPPRYSDFYPRPPRRGRLQCPHKSLFGIKFLSTPSAKRATLEQPQRGVESRNFYPRPPRRGRPTYKHVRNAATIISIHALREEGDYTSTPSLSQAWIFLSTPSAKRATSETLKPVDIHSYFYPRPPRRGRRPTPPPGAAERLISIHALREEGDSWGPGTFCTVKVFLSTPSAKRATAKTETKSLFSNKLYNILHEFRRALIYNGSKNYPNHAK